MEKPNSRKFELQRVAKYSKRQCLTLYKQVRKLCCSQSYQICKEIVLMSKVEMNWNCEEFSEHLKPDYLIVSTYQKAVFFTSFRLKYCVKHSEMDGKIWF